MSDTKSLTLLGNQKTKYSYNEPSYKMLESFKNLHKTPFLITLNCPEFTSLCPKTGQPDFAKIIIEYIPRHLCVESKSLKLYLFAFRNFGEFHEDCVNRIANDIIKVIKPKYIKVIGEFMPRGGIAIVPIVERGNK